MAIKILAFGQIAEITGKRPNIEAADTAILIAQLNEQYPVLKNMKYTIAVNKEITTGVIQLNDNDEVALMPPYSGG